MNTGGIGERCSLGHGSARGASNGDWLLASSRCRRRRLGGGAWKWPLMGGAEYGERALNVIIGVVG